MGKKGKGFDPFGGLFDFNRDGKTDWAEMFVAEKMYEEFKKTVDGDDDDDDFDLFRSSENKYDWRDDCDDDYENGIFADDYETEEEFEEALEEARNQWREEAEDGSEYGLDLEDYDNKEEYEEALEEAKNRWREEAEDGSEYGLDFEDYDNKEEYEEALEEAKNRWRDEVEDGSEYGLDPDDFDTEEEYEEALEEAQNEWRNNVSDGLEYGLDPDDYDTEEEYYEAVEEAEDLFYANPRSRTNTAAVNKAEKKSAYTTKRKEYAAKHLEDLLEGDAYIPSDSNSESEIERCKFILYSDTVAARYLTVFNGFMYTQAVKENFKLPFDIPDEDNEEKLRFSDLFVELADEDTELAVKVWSWCIKEFGSYKHYMQNDCVFYNQILSDYRLFPPEFSELTIDEIMNNPAFGKALLEENPEFPDAAKLAGYALKNNRGSAAAEIYKLTVSNPKGMGRDIELFINGIISDCKDFDGLEAMEAFKEFLLPVIEKTDKNRIQRLLPEFIKKADEFIEYQELYNKKYQYTRHYVWRSSCADGTPYNIDPLNYRTEEVYNMAIENMKHRWRQSYLRKSRKYQLELNDYETAEEYKAARDRRIAELNDPALVYDKTVYTYCGVAFEGSDRLYHYRTEDNSLTVGDMVVVPVGNKGEEAVVEIQTVEKHRRKTAPYPVESTKLIKGRYTEKSEN